MRNQPRKNDSLRPSGDRSLPRREWFACLAAILAAIPWVGSLGTPLFGQDAGASSPESPEPLESQPAPNPFQRVQGKKGLQVQMTDDALTLGVKHAALNVNLSDLIVPPDETVDPADVLTWTLDDQTFRFRRDTIERHDRQIHELSRHGILVYLILIVYQHGDERINQLLLHPNYDRTAPNRLGAFNVATEQGRQWLTAISQFLTNRWSFDPTSSDRPVVVGYIVGNEVNSHWYWSNRGRVSMPEFARDYEQAVRIVHTAARRASSWVRVYLSLEHHWNIRYPAGDEGQTFAGRPFLEKFAELARAGGDFDWHVAFHPYPEDLGDPRFWQDETATRSDDSPRVTFRNLPVLMRFLHQPALQFNGTSRRVILSEQGFHTPDSPDGEDVQAAAYCYASKIVEQLAGIDAFILHRHVDHAHEGGLRLGLWTRKADRVATPDRKKRIYDCFQAAETAAEEDAFRFALPIIGLESWSNLPATET